VPLVFRFLRLLTLLALLGLTLAACRSNKERDVQGAPDEIYKKSHDALRASNYDGAIKGYEALEARFPFSDAARQGKLDLLYAYYRNHEAESAVDAADQFIRENPTHPQVAYAYYIKGLVYFERTRNILERFFSVDLSSRPPSDARRSFAAFQTLVQQYPNSEYAHDARRRMIFLRNRLADYEVAVARYYMKRGAYVGALSRAKYCVEAYDGAPAIQEALQIMGNAYFALNMNDLAQQTAQVYAENFPDDPDKVIKKKKHWYWPF